MSGSLGWSMDFKGTERAAGRCRSMCCRFAFDVFLDYNEGGWVFGTRDEHMCALDYPMVMDFSSCHPLFCIVFGPLRLQ
ncbi:unnamed protein product [Linum tenue]|uniref:Uncharacterized protein n=1 Tax=Linum tenue TaxID=586396 RepID=A0AAV0IJQ2_9ROSI|nr:unnamed protein product [Linum tenue]